MFFRLNQDPDFFQVFFRINEDPDFSPGTWDPVVLFLTWLCVLSTVSYPELWPSFPSDLVTCVLNWCRTVLKDRGSSWSDPMRFTGPHNPRHWLTRWIYCKDDIRVLFKYCILQQTNKKKPEKTKKKHGRKGTGHTSALSQCRRRLQLHDGHKPGHRRPHLAVEAGAVWEGRGQTHTS